MSWDEDLGIGTAQQFFGGGYDSGADAGQDLLNASVGQGTSYSYDSGADASQELLNKSAGGDSSFYDKLINMFGGSGSGIGGLLKMLGPAGSMAALTALMSAMGRQKPTGGGTGRAYAGYQPLTRTVTQGQYGPIARYAADGGIMQGYAQGGPVAMEHGGFVMTKRAVDGAGGPQGIQQLVPGAQMIRGPGTGTSDSIPAYIQGPRGRTPAALSNGEAYVPKDRVQDAGGARKLYAMMNQLQRKA